jgi:5-methylcytosine-specific restriction endonuclease McrA
MGTCLGKEQKKLSKSPSVTTTKSYENKKFKKKKKAIPKTLKKMVWDKYIGENKGKAKCYCCKHQDIRQIDFEAGHVKAESKGGSTTVDNLRPICHQCNISMGTMDMNQFMKTYIKS